MIEGNTGSRKDTFIVKDSKGVCIVAGTVFLAMFVSAVWYVNFNKTTPSADVKIAYLTIIPAIIFYGKAFRNKPVLEINELGIFLYKDMLTDWNNFISACYTQEEKILSISDNFVLLIEYDRPDMPTTYISKIQLPSTLNKSEEDIIEAIEKYHSHHTSMLRLS